MEVRMTPEMKVAIDFIESTVEHRCFWMSNLIIGGFTTICDLPLYPTCDLLEVGLKVLGYKVIVKEWTGSTESTVHIGLSAHTYIYINYQSPGART
jgi:hypothetical protein